jgi:hypothetical protein
MASALIGKAALAAGTEVQLGIAVPVNQTAIMNVSFVNRGAFPAKIRLSVGAGIGSADADAISYDRTLLPNCEYEKMGMVLTAGEKIFVRSDVATVSARAHGLLEGA